MQEAPLSDAVLSQPQARQPIPIYDEQQRCMGTIPGRELGETGSVVVLGRLEQGGVRQIVMAVQRVGSCVSLQARAEAWPEIQRIKGFQREAGYRHES